MSDGHAIESRLFSTESGPMAAARSCSLPEQIPAAVAAIGKTVPALPAPYQKILLGVFKDTQYSDDAFKEALNALIQASPVLTAFNSQAVKESEVPAAATGPFLFWALAQPWASKTPMEDIARALSRWGSQSGGNRYSASPMAAGFMASLAMPLLETRLAMSTAKKTKLRAKCLETIMALSGFSDLHKWSTVLGHRLLINLGLLAQSCGVESVNDKTASAAWEDTARKTMHGMKDAGREAFLNAILASALTPAYKLRACMQSPTTAWLEPTLVERIQLLLPSEEHARLMQIKWLSAKPTLLEKEACLLNQQLVATYCPQLHTLLDLALAPAEWASQAGVIKRMREFTNKSAVFELPSDMEFAL